MNYESKQLPVIAIIGPTACGKTHRGVQLAKVLQGEIVSADSRQVYRGMDIGTGKDLSEYGDVPYHLIDIAPAGYHYNLFEFIRDASISIDDIRSRGRLPIVVGGSGLYVETLLSGMNLPPVPRNPTLRTTLKNKSLPELTDILSGLKTLHNTTDIDTPARAIRAIEIAMYYQEHPDIKPDRANSVAPDSLIIHLDIDRDCRRERISNRLHTRLTEGMIEEVKHLLETGLSPEDLIYYGLEYKYITRYLTGEISYQEMVQTLEIAIHQFAKRQATWFRGMERRGFTLYHLPYDLPNEDFIKRVKDLIELHLSNQPNTI